MSGDMLRTVPDDIAGHRGERIQVNRKDPALVNPEHAPAAFDPDVARATDLQAQLEQTARGHGFLSFAQMQRRLVEEREALDPENRYQLLKRIAPALHEVNEYAKRPSLPETDASGLVAIQDMVKSVSRLIRVLLLGYTPEEQGEVADRMRAERAMEVDSAMSQSMAEEHHQTSMDRLATIARTSLPAKVIP